MAEAAGLALGVAGVAGLFTTCIECFDIVVAGKNFSEDYEQLCALFSLQRARFGLWGESVGLIPNPIDGYCLRYDENINRPDIRPGIERILNNIKTLLNEAGKVDDKYGLREDQAQGSGSEVMTSRGIDIFKGSFDRFKRRIRKHQKQTSAWNVTRWAIHDAEKFESMINRLEKFVDGLEKITTSLGLLEQQHARLQEEIESISDIQSLRLLRDASSGRHSSQNDVSDTASRRLVSVAESIAEQRTIASASLHFTMATTADSFVTAKTKPSATTGSLKSEAPPIPGAWPKSIKSESHGPRSRAPPSKLQHKAAFKPNISCAECLEEHYKCVPKAGLISCSRCIQTKRECSFLRDRGESIRQSLQGPPPGMSSGSWSPRQELPQNQRLLSKLIENAEPRRPLSFAAGDAHYGDHLATIKSENEAHWLEHSGNILAHANSGSSAAKRMFLELRNIRQGKVPFVSATPLDDRLDKILASIEGPPETPFEGGVFWITVRLSEKDPYGPPLMRFQTKIYHPNISPQGHICADYREKWSSFLSAGKHKHPVKDQDALWYRTKSTDIQWSLGALLTALCGLLATPDVDDPLVPEIAHKYLEDYDGYCENAKLYTQRYATGERPQDQDLYFLEESLPADDHLVAPSPASISSGGSSLWSHESRASLQASLREVYDDKVPYERPGRSYSPTSSDSGSGSSGNRFDPCDEVFDATQRVLFRCLLHANYLHNVDLGEVIRMTRRSLPFAVSDTVTDFHISHSLLTWTIHFLQHPLSLQTMGIYTQNFCDQLQVLCSEHISVSLGRAEVFQPNSVRGIMPSRYRVAIGPRGSSPSVTPLWQFTRHFSGFEKLMHSMFDTHARDWMDVSSPTQNYHEQFPRLTEDQDPFILAPLLEKWLNHILEVPSNVLLWSRSFMMFTEPDSDFEPRSNDFRPISFSHSSSTCGRDHNMHAPHILIPHSISHSSMTCFKFRYRGRGERVTLRIVTNPYRLDLEERTGGWQMDIASITDIRAGDDAKHMREELWISDADAARFFSIYYISSSGLRSSLHLVVREDYVRLWIDILRRLHGCLGS